MACSWAKITHQFFQPCLALQNSWEDKGPRTFGASPGFSIVWVNHSILYSRPGKLFWAQLCIHTLRTQFELKPDVQPTMQIATNEVGDIHTQQQSQKIVKLHNWSKHRTDIRCIHTHLWLLKSTATSGTPDARDAVTFMRRDIWMSQVVFLDLQQYLAWGISQSIKT